jgi:hypothetical protein
MILRSFDFPAAFGVMGMRYLDSDPLGHAIADSPIKCIRVSESGGLRIPSFRVAGMKIHIGYIWF